VPLKPPLAAVIFDLDGVLLDTEPLYTRGIQEVVGAYGKVYDWSIKRDMMGRSELEGAKLLLARLDLPLSEAEYLSRREPILERLFRTSPAMPGAADLVRALAMRGLPIAVATSSRARFFEMKTAPHAWFASFRTVVCGDDPEVVALKPDPQIFLVAAARLGIAPARCLVIEDSPAGVLAARRAGMQVAALPDPALGAAALAEADLVASSHDEIREALFATLEANT
jgi:pseudouridine-5'-monophosphatase